MLSECERLLDVKCTSCRGAERTSTTTETIQHIVNMKQFAVRSVRERASVSGTTTVYGAVHTQFSVYLQPWTSGDLQMCLSHTRVILETSNTSALAEFTAATLHLKNIRVHLQPCFYLANTSSIHFLGTHLKSRDSVLDLVQLGMIPERTRGYNDSRETWSSWRGTA